ICTECLTALKSKADTPPPLSLANNMWTRKIPEKLQALTFPEQLLIALLYPCVFVFKLYPKKVGGKQENLQRGMRGNVSSYELNMASIQSMVEGNLMPRPPAILVSVLTVTFIGQGKLPKGWLHSTFKVRRDFVGGALLWLKEAENKHYEDIVIDSECIHCLPLDGVPEENFEVVRHSTDIGLVDEEQDGYVPDSEDINEVNEGM
ncbi:hypothetical protein C8R41DRAFT_752408, partial [Lentinula lateritia]